MSFDVIFENNIHNYRKSQSLWNRAMSFDKSAVKIEQKRPGLNPFGTGQCLSTPQSRSQDCVTSSQSLWNRAMSFD